jgi:hypothetical protein
MTIDGSGLTPSGDVAFLYGSGAGTDLVPAGPCAGAVSGLSGLRLRFLSEANGAGLFSLSPTIPAPACGTTIQLLDIATCSLTNVATLGGGECTDVEFPAGDSVQFEAGGGIPYLVSDADRTWTTGSYVEDTLVGDSTSITSITLDFDWEDGTGGCHGGLATSFDVTVNGISVGRWESIADGADFGPDIVPVFVAVDFAPIAGEGPSSNEYTVRMEQSSATICGGGGSWNFLAGGNTALCD